MIQNKKWTHNTSPAAIVQNRESAIIKAENIVRFSKSNIGKQDSFRKRGQVMSRKYGVMLIGCGYSIKQHSMAPNSEKTEKFLESCV